MSFIPKENPDVQYGQLRFTAGVKDAFGSVFRHGRYSPPINALQEFVDNSAAQREKDGCDPTIIRLRVDRNVISCRDVGGNGGDAETIQRFVSVGETEDIGVSRRGAGAKAAAWFLGRDIKIVAKPPGETREYVADIDGFGDPDKPYEGRFPIISQASEIDKARGQFSVTITGIKEPEKLPTAPALGRALSETYRPLLGRDDSDVERQVIGFDGSQPVVTRLNDRVDMAIVTGRHHRRVNHLRPMPIPLKPGYSEDLQLVETKDGEPIAYWAGELDTEHPDAVRVTPGVRAYIDGRLIDRLDLGINLRDPHFRGLVGEAHVDHVRGIKDTLVVNKSAGVDKKSPQWQRTQASLRVALEPLIQTLSDHSVTVKKAQPASVSKALANARKFADMAFRSLAADPSFMRQEQVSSVLSGSYNEPTTMIGVTVTNGKSASVESPSEGAILFDHEKRKSATLPGPESQIKGRPGEKPPRPPHEKTPQERGGRMRRSFIDGVEFGELPPDVVSEVMQMEDRGRRDRRVLMLNTEHPAIQYAQLRGPLSLTRLAGEELVDHIAAHCTEGQETLVGFNQVRGQLRRAFDEHLQRLAEAEQISSQLFE